jgi:hypothetical protein
MHIIHALFPIIYLIKSHWFLENHLYNNSTYQMTSSRERLWKEIFHVITKCEFVRSCMSLQILTTCPSYPPPHTHTHSLSLWHDINDLTFFRKWEGENLSYWKNLKEIGTRTINEKFRERDWKLLVYIIQCEKYRTMYAVLDDFCVSNSCGKVHDPMD